jgi:hypothetical protein
LRSVIPRGITWSVWSPSMRAEVVGEPPVRIPRTPELRDGDVVGDIDGEERDRGDGFGYERRVGVQRERHGADESTVPSLGDVFGILREVTAELEICHHPALLVLGEFLIVEHEQPVLGEHGTQILLLLGVQGPGKVELDGCAEVEVEVRVREHRQS